MLNLILEDRGLRVTSFGRKSENLEEVFLRMTQQETVK
jgi:hypothetical protein